MRILFSLRHLGSLRLYESVLRRLVADGHDVRILANRRDSIGSQVDPETLMAEISASQWIWMDVRPDAWTDLASVVAIWLDYLRFLGPKYDETPRPRMRVGEWVPAALRRISAWPLVRSNAGRMILVSALRIIERVLPRTPELDALMQEHRPDLVVISPMLELGSRQIEVLRSARAFGARTILSLGNWDHLSNKGRISELPTQVFVWNDTQVGEAVELHGVPRERIVITGAQTYDQWFGRVPARTREQFCAMLKLPADRPLLLYACSAMYPIEPSEARFVQRWIEQIRASDDPLLRSAAILVRPHPLRLEEWNDVDLSSIPDVAVYGSLPIDSRSKEDYFDSLYFAGAVVGLNTTAFIEAAIVGRPVHTIDVPEFRERQQGPLHFVYLTTVGGGVLRVGRTFDEHRAQLALSLRQEVGPELNASFVRAFVRPLGLDRSATDVYVDAVEALARAATPAPVRDSIWAPMLRLALKPCATALHRYVAHLDEPVDRTLIELQRLHRRRDYRDARESERQQRDAARQGARAEKVRLAEAARQQEERARQERIDASEREKRELKVERERRKLQHQRSKRRTAVMTQIRRRLGIQL